MGIDSLPDDYLQQRYAPFEIKDTLWTLTNIQFTRVLSIPSLALV
jgi:hypothetical protein